MPESFYIVAHPGSFQKCLTEAEARYRGSLFAKKSQKLLVIYRVFEVGFVPPPAPGPVPDTTRGV